MRRVRLASVALVGALLMTAGVGAADTDKSGRVKFVKRADEKCQPQRNDAKRLVANGVRLLTKKHPRVRAAGREFVRAYRELRTGYRRVARLHKPSGEDRVRIARWLRRERAATATGVRSALALKRKELDRARRLTRKAAAQEQRAFRPVRNFKFQDCKPL